MKITRRRLFGVLAGAVSALLPFVGKRAAAALVPLPDVPPMTGLVRIAMPDGEGRWHIGPDLNPVADRLEPMLEHSEHWRSAPLATTDGKCLYDHPRSNRPLFPIDFSGREINRGYADAQLIPAETRRLWRAA